MTAPQPLTRAQMELLEFERATWASAGRRDAALVERFGHSPIRHAQILNRLIDTPAALEYDAQLVNRLRNLRDQRRAARTGSSR